MHPIDGPINAPRRICLRPFIAFIMNLPKIQFFSKSVSTILSFDKKSRYISGIFLDLARRALWAAKQSINILNPLKSNNYMDSYPEEVGDE